MPQSEEHVPVLLEEAVLALAVQPDGCYVDGTFGRGGHSRRILQQLGFQGRLVGFDKDPRAVDAGRMLEREDARFCMVSGSFAALAEESGRQGWAGKVNGVLLDLGVSSPQLDDSSRGFSFTKDGPLDMRMNPQEGVSAAQWLANADEGEIARVLKEFGEERYARRMARAVAMRKEIKPFLRTLDLAEVLTAANPRWERDKHPATRAFQGIRIHVNRELVDVELGLQAALEVVAVGGRLVVISFHSLEDRLVKQFMRRQSRGGSDDLPRDLPVEAAEFLPRLRLLGKPVCPGEAEVKVNPRARSAVMRVAEKLR